MSEANKQLARRWFEEVWNKRNAAAIDEMLSADGKSHGFPDPDSVLVGPEDFKVMHSSFCGAFPDLQITIEDVITEGDKVAIRWTTTMTHLGDHLGIPATSKKVRLPGSSFLIVRDGMIQEGWNFMELEGLIHRLRVGPEPASL
jgi:steroid delta-isomerase-like uncharacterized protein